MHGRHSPIEPNKSHEMEFKAKDVVMVKLEGDDLGPWKGTVVRKHQSTGWYWVRFEKRFNGHCLPIQWRDMSKIRELNIELLD